LKSARSGDITTFGIDNSPDHKLLTKAPEIDAKANAARRKAIIQELVSNGIVGPYKTSDDGTTGSVTIDAGKVLETKKSIDEVKRYVSTGLPTLVYGRSGGMINSIGVSSMNDAALATVNMIRNAPEDSTKPDATKTRGIPMRIIPTEMSVEMMGMPTLQYMQQVFVDLKTGTTADNIYAITNIDHKIGLDGFTTSLKLIPPGDAYASYESPITKAGIAIDSLKSVLGIQETPPVQQSNASTAKKSGGKLPSFLSKLKFPSVAGKSGLKQAFESMFKESGGYVIIAFDSDGLTVKNALYCAPKANVVDMTAKLYASHSLWLPSPAANCKKSFIAVIVNSQAMLSDDSNKLLRSKLSVDNKQSSDNSIKLGIESTLADDIKKYLG
jgi:hypothetical protein